MPRTVFILSCIAIFAAACGPNVLRARQTVMNPLVRDSNEYAFTRRAVIVRKETRARPEHTIVGAYGTPPALDQLHEPAEILPQKTDGNGLYVDAFIFSDRKDEIADFPKKFSAWLEVEGGKRVKCRVHRTDPIRDYTTKVSGGANRPYQVVVDKQNRTAKTLYAWQEVENDFTLFGRGARFLCMSDAVFLTLETKYLVFVIEGYQRQRRYRFDFTTNVEALLKEDGTSP